MNAAALLLLLGVAVHYAPEPLADVGAGTVAAWETVAYAMEACALWVCAWLAAPQLWSPLRAGAVRVVAAYMACEGAQRMLGRLMWPMHQRPPVAADTTYMEAAFGPWVVLISPMAALLATAYVAAQLSAGGVRHGG